MLAIVAMPHAQEASAAVKERAADGLVGQQAAQKKRKRVQSEAPESTGAPQAQTATPDADSSQHWPFVYIYCTVVPTSTSLSPMDRLHMALLNRNAHDVCNVN